VAVFTSGVSATTTTALLSVRSTPYASVGSARTADVTSVGTPLTFQTNVIVVVVGGGGVSASPLDGSSGSPS
jgi:hypothetical protein